MNLGLIADAIARRCDSTISDNALRDRADIWTEGELDTFQLDLLTGMVRDRLSVGRIESVPSRGRI